jgi:hypothetical protein
MEWSRPARDLLVELLSPVPVLERPGIKQSCILQAEETALAEDAAQVEPAHVASSYLAQAPESLKERAIRHLEQKEILFHNPPDSSKQ